jgi:hypothetical protein
MPERLSWPKDSRQRAPYPLLRSASMSGYRSHGPVKPITRAAWSRYRPFLRAVARPDPEETETGVTPQSGALGAKLPEESGIPSGLT